MKEQESIEQVMKIYKLKIVANNALRKAFEAIQHHNKLTKKIESEFKKIYPNVCFYYDGGKGGMFSQTTIRIWGKEIGLDYENGMFYCMNNSSLAENWQKTFELELDRMDCSDSLENLEHEAEHYSKLKEIEEQIIFLQTKAKELKEDGYIPKSAKPDCRGASHFWNDFSYTTKRKFPKTFNYIDR